MHRTELAGMPVAFGFASNSAASKLGGELCRLNLSGTGTCHEVMKMSARDNFHSAVKNALIREGWKITHDPYFIRYGDTEFYIDLGAEKILAAEKEGIKIAVEIKNFISDSTVYEFHTALGQFITYRNILEETEPDRILYLAVPADIYDSFFRSRFGQMSVRKNQIRLIAYNAQREEIELWTN